MCPCITVRRFRYHKKLSFKEVSTTVKYKVDDGFRAWHASRTKHVLYLVCTCDMSSIHTVICFRHACMNQILQKILFSLFLYRKKFGHCLDNKYFVYTLKILIWISFPKAFLEVIVKHHQLGPDPGENFIVSIISFTPLHLNVRSLSSRTIWVLLFHEWKSILLSSMLRTFSLHHAVHKMSVIELNRTHFSVQVEHVIYTSGFHPFLCPNASINFRMEVSYTSISTF